MRKLTFEVLRNDERMAYKSLEAYLLRYEEDGKTREFLIPEFSNDLCEAEHILMKKLHEHLKTSM